MVEQHCAKGIFSGADLGTQRLGRKWLKGAQSPSGNAIPHAQSLNGPETSEAHSVSVNDVGEGLRVGQASGGGFSGFKG